MSYIVLARKWRPRRFAELAGQEHVVRALGNALDSNKVHHAFLFTGTRGVGKTTVARILAKSLNCERGVSAEPCGTCGACREIDEGRFVDLIEVDAASRTKVDDTRELLDNVQYAPTRGRYKVYLIDEVHMLSNHSFNALLKTLEEPPPHVKFLLATTDPQKLPITVLSRCLQFSLKRLSAGLIADRLKYIATAEGLRLEPAAAALLARAAEGSMRDALSLMDQLIAFGGGDLGEANARSMLGTIDRGHVMQILEALSRQDGPGLIAHVRDLDRDAPDYDRALGEIAAILQRVAIVQIVPDAALEDEEYAAQTLALLARVMTPEDVQLYYQIALGGRRDLAMAPEPRAGFEMCLLRMLAFRPETAAAPDPASVPGAVAAQAPSRRAAPLASPVTSAFREEPSGVATARVAPPESAAGADASTPRPGIIDEAGWAGIVEAARMSGMVRQFALNCIPVGHANGVLRLRFDRSAAHRRTPQIEEKLIQCLNAYAGVDLRVVFEASEAALVTPARHRAMADEENIRRAALAFDQDPTVQALRARFGAEVDTASVKPTQ